MVVLPDDPFLGADVPGAEYLFQVGGKVGGGRKVRFRALRGLPRSHAFQLRQSAVQESHIEVGDKVAFVV